jgi:hypothetical protein
VIAGRVPLVHDGDTWCAVVDTRKRTDSPQSVPDDGQLSALRQAGPLVAGACFASNAAEAAAILRQLARLGPPVSPATLETLLASRDRPETVERDRLLLAGGKEARVMWISSHRGRITDLVPVLTQAARARVAVQYNFLTRSRYDVLCIEASPDGLEAATDRAVIGAREEGVELRPFYGSQLETWRRSLPLITASEVPR